MAEFNSAIVAIFFRRQMDIGLEMYETKDLFVRLLTPTFFVIITVMQIHYFHDDFLEITSIQETQPTMWACAITIIFSTTSIIEILLTLFLKLQGET